MSNDRPTPNQVKQYQLLRELLLKARLWKKKKLQTELEELESKVKVVKEEIEILDEEIKDNDNEDMTAAKVRDKDVQRKMVLLMAEHTNKKNDNLFKAIKTVLKRHIDKDEKEAKGNNKSKNSTPENQEGLGEGR